MEQELRARDIAVIGMAGRFPGAPDLATFWQNLAEGKDAVTFFTDEQLAAAGVPAEEYQHPNYVKAGVILDGVEEFDAGFFGYNPGEAQLLDPQQRLFLEHAWEALEQAGYTPHGFEGLIGVYAGVAWNTYLLSNLTAHRELFDATSVFQTFITSDKDFMPTRVSYKLNLRGPSMIIQTSCSTSLVAVHQACMALLVYDCDMALAGGVTVKVPQHSGYMYQEGGLASPDGRCRSFDARAQGTIFGSGVGVVVLKRLADAVAAGDPILAVIRGSAINNDGSVKVSYTAPSVEGQAEVIAAAQAAADVDAETIGYVEAHGTATALGDPIEVTALTRVFREHTQKRQFCALGSVKSNIGHLDAAAGIAGLIKAVLALQHGQIPPAPHFEAPNPKIDFANSPFFVNTTLQPWNAAGAPRRAAVSSFGVGGTNAHLILEEAPRLPPSDPARPWQLLVLSARSEGALDRAATRLAAHLRANPQLNLADVAYTLQQGRSVFRHRRAVVCGSLAEAAHALEHGDPQRVRDEVDQLDPRTRPVVFMFPGQGAQYTGMAAGLYESEPVFRQWVDRCAEILQPHLGCDIRALIYPQEPRTENQEPRTDSGVPVLGSQFSVLEQTQYTQPALFVVEYALAQMWMAWGVRPAALIGHSVGEYVAACLAGVFALEDALRLVAARGRMMQSMPAGAMLAVSMCADELLPLLGPGLDLAAVNGPQTCVVAGPEQAIEALARQLAARDLPSRRLHTSHAFHSAMMDALVAPFAAEVARVAQAAPQLPFISNVSGTWITAEEATDPAYWARHLRQPVRFAAGVAELLEQPDRLLLEVGPGTGLGTLVRQQCGEALTLSSLRHPQDIQDDQAFLLGALGRLWLAGLAIEWGCMSDRQRRRRVPLPAYPFERQRYWIEPGPQVARQPGKTELARCGDPADWFYLPSWRRALPPKPPNAETLAGRWLLFEDAAGVAAALARRLADLGRQVTFVAPGQRFERAAPGRYRIAPGRPEDYTALLDELHRTEQLPGAIVHLWSVDKAGEMRAAQDHGFYSLLFLAQALGRLPGAPELRIGVVSRAARHVAGEMAPAPEHATLLGLCKVIPQEYLNLDCRSIDLVLPGDGALPGGLADQLIAELAAPETEVVAYRDRQRWVQTYEAVRLEHDAVAPLRRHGNYVITGGLSGIGLALAQHLARSGAARLALIEDEPFPPRATWDAWLDEHDPQDSVSRKIRQACALEQDTQVQVHAADLTSAQSIRHALDQAATPGQVHGVIHAAGVDGEQSFRPIEEADRAACELHFAPRVYGLAALAEALGGQRLDFCCVASSLSAVLGGRGYAAYTAANLFMDAFVQCQAQSGAGRWLCINWDAWQAEDEQQITALSPDLARLALNATEVGAVFERALAAVGLTQVVVSTADLAGRVAQWRERLDSIRADLRQPSRDGPRHPRPRLQTGYTTPSSELEQQIADIWQRVLGFEQIGIHDNFFELGGDSLIALRLVGRLKAELEIDLPVVRLYQALTIQALAELLEQSEQQSQQRGARLQERKEDMQRRKQYQQMRRTRHER